MDRDLNHIILELTEHESRLASQLSELNEKVRSTADQLTQIRNAKIALQGKAAGKEKRIAAATPERQVKVSNIEDIMKGILKLHGPMAAQDLLSQVKARLLSQGIRRHGMKGHFTNACSSPSFKIDDAQVVHLSD